MIDTPRLMREWLEVLPVGPAEAWREKVSEDIVIRLPFAPPGVEKELRGIGRALEAMIPVWQSKKRFDWHDVVIRRTEDPQLLLATARSEALLVSGQLYANSYVILTRFAQGKVIEHVEYFNPLPVIEIFAPVTSTGK